MEVKTILTDAQLREAADKGADELINLLVETLYQHVGGSLTQENIQRLNTHQLTLLAYHTLREEVMTGGFVQLIHNGDGPFIFLNPFARSLKAWGLLELGRLISKAYPLFVKHRQEIEIECDDEEFMGLFERFSDFDDFDDFFVEHEEDFTLQVAQYITEHTEQFVGVKEV